MNENNDSFIDFFFYFELGNLIHPLTATTSYMGTTFRYLHIARRASIPPSITDFCLAQIINCNDFAFSCLKQFVRYIILLSLCSHLVTENPN